MKEPAAEKATMGDAIRQSAIDKGAKALREHQMKGRYTVDWEKLPNSQKKKWIVAAKIVLDAADAGT